MLAPEGPSELGAGQWVYVPARRARFAKWKNPIGIAINSAGTRAFVTNNVSGNVSVVNLNTDTVIDIAVSLR